MRFSRVLLVCGLTLTTLGVGGMQSYSLEQAPPIKYALTSDRCLALLDPSPSVDPAPQSLRTNIVARQTAMGLMLGLRSAVGPREGSTGQKQKVSGIDSERVQAIARYRHCRSQQTLESFASN